MNRALIWKEFREQGLIVAALVLLGGGVLVAAGLIFPPSPDPYGDTKMTLEPRKLALVLLVLASGVVVGGTLFAGEREQGTFPYLELLPVPRWRVWLGKVIAGLVLVSIAAGLLFAVAAAVGIAGPPAKLPFWVLITFTLAIAAYTWGALGSSFAKTSLAACGLGLLMAVGLSIPIYTVSLLGVTLFERAADVDGANSLAHHPEYPAFGTLFGLVAIPLMISAWIYTSPDRNRLIRDIRLAKGGPADPVRRKMPLFSFSPFRSLRAALWMAARQNRVLTIVLGGCTAISGIALLQPDLPALFVWPVATLMLGTIVGVTGWSDEQNSGAFRFWAERRMPIGRLWLAKVVYGLLLVVGLMVLLALPSVIAARTASGHMILANAFRARIFLDRSFPVAEYLFLWPVYGFAFGHLAGMLFRKAAVGTAVGVMSGGAIVALWLPSLLAGGIHWYQLWIPPLLALATARALVWSWALDQLGQRRALLRLGFGSSTIAAMMVGGILYRIVEIPETATTEADIAFRKEIPPFETNLAGQEIRRGGVLFAEMRLKQRDLPPAESPLWPEGSQEVTDASVPTREKASAAFINQLGDVLELGWPANRPDADAWLDACMANGWAEPFVLAARLPLGTVEDPIELSYYSRLRHLDNLQGCELFLLARGLQLQVHGKPEAFIESMTATLSLVRNLRNKSLYTCAYPSRRAEISAHLALQRWLEKLGDRPDLLKEMLDLLKAHDAACPKLGADGNLTDQVVLRNSVNAPTQFVKDHLQSQPWNNSRSTTETNEALDNETDFVSFAWAVPWERERLRRLVGLGNNRVLTHEERLYFQGLPGLSEFTSHTMVAIEKSSLRLNLEELTARRASILMVALRLHRAEKGALPTKLESLVPAYLPAVPLDPYDDQPFRYRISKGETLQMELLPPPKPATPTSIAGLVGAPSFEFENNPGLYKPRPPVTTFPGSPGGPLVNFPIIVGAIIGGPGYEIEINPGPYVVFPRGVGTPPGAGSATPMYRMLDVPAGRGILWSIGPDKIDDGGTRQALLEAGALKSVDLIFPVPEPAEAKR